MSSGRNSARNSDGGDSGGPPNAAYVEEEGLPPVFHDMADQILPDAHSQLEDIVEFLEQSTVNLLQKVEQIPKEHPEPSSPRSADQAAQAPESVRLRRAIQALACVCRDSRKDLVEVSAQLEEAKDEYEHALGGFEDDLKQERERRGAQMTRLQKKLDAARSGGGGGGGGDSARSGGSGGSGTQEDADTIADLTEELAFVRKQLSAEKQLRRQEAADRAEDAKRIRASAEASFQANTESLRSQVGALRQQLEDRNREESARGQNVNDMALVIAKMSTDLNEEKKVRDNLEQQVRILTEEKANAPPPTREGALLEAEIGRLTSQLNESSARHEGTIASLQARLEETETTLTRELAEATAERDKVTAALAEAQAAREQTRNNVDTIRNEYTTMLESERKQHSTELELAQSEAAAARRNLDSDRNALRAAETKVFELSLQEERLTMELNALKVRLLHSETEAESIQRRYNQAAIHSQHQQQQNAAAPSDSASDADGEQQQQQQSDQTAAAPSSPVVVQQHQQQYQQHQQQYHGLDAKELLRQLEGANMRNTELQKALGDADKRIHSQMMQLESSKHTHRFELDDAERRADEARKNLLHSSRQHEQMMIALSPERRAEAVLSNSSATQATDSELEELKLDLKEAQGTIDDLRQQLDNAYDSARAQRENMEKRYTSTIADNEVLIRNLSDQLRAARFRGNKVQQRLTVVEEEHAQMSAEYDTISGALQKADSQSKQLERDAVDLNMENTSLRNKLKQTQREIEDLRLAMQMREREMELEYAQQLKSLKAQIGGDNSDSGKRRNSASAGSNNNSSSRNGVQLFRQLSPASEEGGSQQKNDNLPLTPRERVRQLDEVIMQMHGDSLALDKKERETRDQHIGASSRLQKDIDELRERAQANPDSEQLQQALAGKQAEMEQLNEAMGKFLRELGAKRHKLSDDHRAVMAEREKIGATVTN